MDQEKETAETTETQAAPVAPYLAETLTGDREPYDFDRATIHIGVTIYPDDGSAEGRLATVTARSHADAPVTVTSRMGAHISCPVTLIGKAMDKLEADFPAREAASRERERLAAEKAKAVPKTAPSAERAKAAKKKLAAKPATKPAAKPAGAKAAKEKPAAAPKPPKKAPVEKAVKAAPAKPTKPAEPQMQLFGALGSDPGEVINV